MWSSAGTFCGTCRFQRMMRSTGCQWPRGHTITVSIHSAPPELGYEQTHAAVDNSFAAWREVAGVRFDLRPPGARANVEISTIALGGPLGVLAQATLPCGAGPSARHWQQYDDEEQWVISATPETPEIDFLTVATHETGHSLGLPHAPGGSDNMMAPAYTGRRGLGDWDFAEILARYGPPSAPPPPGPAPSDPFERACREAHAILSAALGQGHGK